MNNRCIVPVLRESVRNCLFVAYRIVKRRQWLAWSFLICSLIITCHAFRRSELHRSAKSGDLGGLKRALLATRQSVDELDIWGMTALQLAAKKNQGNAIGFLLQNGADPNCVARGMTALHVAASVGSVEAAEALINGGAHIDAQDTIDSRTPLHMAALHSQIGMTSLLVSKGADGTIKDNHGMTAYDLAVLSQIRLMLP